MYYPLNYDKINLYQGTFSPSEQYTDSYAFNFWMRALYQRALSVFDFLNLPADFNRQEIDLLYYLLYIQGYCGAFPTDDYGNIINTITPKGYNVFYAPDQFIVNNPKLDTLKTKDFNIYHLGDIDNDDFDPSNYGVILKLSPDCMGIYDILVYYAEKLANMSAGLDMNIENSKFAYVLGANNKSGRTFLKKLIDKIHAGVSAIIYDSTITPSTDVDTFEFFNRDNLKSSYMVTEFNSDIQTIINQFDAEIGIVNVPYEKKERMTEFESKSKQSDGIARATLWKDTMQRCFDEFNELFGENVKVVYNYEYMVSLDESVDEDISEGGEVNE